MADPYVYPGTSVLRNLLDLQEAAALQAAERLLTAVRMERPPPDVPISYDGYKALHRHLFERVYEWAGEPRSVNLMKGETLFTAPGRVDPEMQRQFTHLSHERYLRDLPPARFAERAALYLCEINVIHPFREGNGRTLRAFLDVLARQAGHAVSLQHIEPVAWNQASIAGVAADYGPMARVISAALDGGQGRGGPSRDMATSSGWEEAAGLRPLSELGAAGSKREEREQEQDRSID
jgi:cell filamentation protein